jgi:tetratricopeptide (TPR) repeat protein
MAALCEGDASEALQGLVAAGLVHRSRRDRDTCYEVADPLLQEVAYETLPRHVRGESHRRAATVAATPIDRARHLERAAAYLPDDEELRVEAATAAATAGLALIEGFRLTDGVQLVQRAIELGYREPRHLLRLARTLNEQQRIEELWEVLDLVPDDPDHPALAAEKIHIGAVALTFRDPAAGLPGLEEAARRWSALGETAKHGWALANRGVALFFLGRNHESDASLRESLGVFREAGERDGEMAAYRFLALVCPDDPHAHEWVTESLRRAEEVGDRTAQVNSYNSLSWHHFMRSRLGGADDTAELRYYLDRLLETAHDLGMHELETHGLGMAASLARLQCRVDDAGRHAAAALSLAVTEPPATTLVHVAAFASARAHGDPAEAPEVDDRAVDPVSLICAYLVGEELIFEGRADGISRAMHAIERRPGQSALEGVIAGFGKALALIVLGRHAEARSSAEWVISAATTLHAPIAEAAGRALLAEVALVVDGDRDEAVRLLESAPKVSGGLAHLLVLRSRARLGSDAAARALQEAVDALHMPGLALPVGVTS